MIADNSNGIVLAAGLTIHPQYFLVLSALTSHLQRRSYVTCPVVLSSGDMIFV
jgi:hypothetical protein